MVAPYALVTDLTGLVVVLSGDGVTRDYVHRLSDVVRQIGVGVMCTRYPWWMQPGNYLEIRHGRMDWYSTTESGTCPVDLRYPGRVQRNNPLTAYAVLANVVGTAHEIGHAVFGPGHPDVPGGFRFVMHPREPGFEWTPVHRREGPAVCREFVRSYLSQKGWGANPKPDGWVIVSRTGV